MQRIRRAQAGRTSAGGARDVDALVNAALARRGGLLADPQTNAVRLFHGAADGLDGLVIEKFGDVLVAQFHEGRLIAPESAGRASTSERVRERPRAGDFDAYRDHAGGDQRDDGGGEHRDGAPREKRARAGGEQRGGAGSGQRDVAGGGQRDVAGGGQRDDARGERRHDAGGESASPGRLARQIAERLCARVGARAVYRKVFPRDRSAAGDIRPEHRDRQPWIGEPVEEEFAVREAGLKLLVRPYDGLSTGLFLDQRENRGRVRAAAAGRRVLNTFAYTCGFGVAAGAGGAAEVVNVDVSKRYLEWGKRNLGINGLGLEGQWFICSDVFEYFRRARRQGRVFDLVILDPPTFGRDKQSGTAFSIASDLERLVCEAAGLMPGGGRLLLSTNHRGTTVGRLKQAVARAGRVMAMDVPRLPDDFAGDEGYAKCVWCEVGPGG